MKCPFRVFPQLCVKPRKLNVAGLPSPRVPPISLRIAAELDDPRFVGMQIQPELREALAQFCQKLLCLRTILKADDEVIRETDDDDIAVRPLLSPSLGPKVEHIMKIEVRPTVG